MKKTTYRKVAHSTKMKCPKKKEGKESKREEMREKMMDDD